MINTFIASRLNKLNNDLCNILKLYKAEEMSTVNVNSSRIPRKPCSCVHHEPPASVPCPATSGEKSKPRCCYCKRKLRACAKSSEKSSKTPDESTAGEPHVDDPGAPGGAPSPRRIQFDELQRELADEKTKVEELGRNLKNLQGETETLKNGRDVVLTQVSSLQEQIAQFTAENKSLKCKCEDLQYKLGVVEESEEKRTSEISDEFQKMRNVIKDKEDLLINEKSQLNKVIAELTNTVKEQKKRISELTAICNRQKSKIEDDDKILTSKTGQIVETEKKLRSKCCECKELREEVENIKRCLNEESKAANDFKKELDTCKDNCRCELLIKDKIIEDQSETIKRLKNLLHDSEKIAQQAAREYEIITDELYSERQQNNELKVVLEEMEENVTRKKSSKCQQCKLLEERLNYVLEQKEKALIAAKYAATKLCESTDEYQTQLNAEKQQCRYLMSVLKQKDGEIECLKDEIVHMRLHN